MVFRSVVIAAKVIYCASKVLHDKNKFERVLPENSVRNIKTFRECLV